MSSHPKKAFVNSHYYDMLQLFKFATVKHIRILSLFGFDCEEAVVIVGATIESTHSENGKKTIS